MEDKENEVEVLDPTYPTGDQKGNTHHDVEMSGPAHLDSDTFPDTPSGPLPSVDPIPNLPPMIDPPSYSMPTADPTLVPDAFDDDGSILGGGAK